MKFNNVLDYNRNLLTNLSGLYLQGGRREGQLNVPNIHLNF